MAKFMLVAAVTLAASVSAQCATTTGVPCVLPFTINNVPGSFSSCVAFTKQMPFVSGQTFKMTDTWCATVASYTRGASSANKDAWGVCDPALCTGVSVTTAPSPKPTPAAPTHKPTTAAPTKKPTIANWGFGGYLAEPAPCTQACVLFSKAKPFINSKVAPADPPAGDSKASWCNTGAVPYSASGSGKKSWGYCNPFVATSQPTVAVVVTTQPTSASEPPATDAPSAQPTVAQTSAPTPTDFTGAPSVAMTDAPSVASHTTTSAPVAAPTAMPSLVVIGNGTTSAPSASNSSASFRSASGFVAAACLGAVVAVGA